MFVFGARGKSNIKLKSCQSIAEYVLILSIVMSAVVSMKIYITRAVQARVKDLSDTLITPKQVNEVNPIVPLLESGPIAKKSTSTAKSTTQHTQNAGTITLTKSISSSSESKYLIQDDPDKKVNDSHVPTKPSLTVGDIIHGQPEPPKE